MPDSLLAGEQTQVDATQQTADSKTGQTTTVPAADASDWRSQIPAEIKNEKVWESVKDMPTLFKNYVEAQKFVGNSIRLPNEKDKPEDAAKKREDIYNKLGRPAKPEDYKVELPKLPEYAGEWDEGKLAGFKALAHRIGLNGEQLTETLKWYAGQLGEDEARRDENFRQTEKTLREEYGANFGRKIALGQRAAAKYGGEEFVNTLVKYGLDNHPAVVRALSNMGAAMAEDNLISGHVEGVLGPEGIKAKLAQVMASEAYTKGSHPDHEAAVKEVNALFTAQLG